MPVVRHSFAVALAAFAIFATSASLAQASFRGANGKIAFSAGEWPHDIYTMNPDGSDLTRLTYAPESDSHAAWSPDGRKIAFSSWRSGLVGVYVMNEDGTHQTRLTDDRSANMYPSWSPDGRRIAFESLRDGNWEIYVMNADGSGQTRLTTFAGEDSRPVFSPDGTKIAFYSYRYDNWDIYVMNADGSATIRLTDDPLLDWGPTWSPDGTKIAWSSRRNDPDRGEIYTMNPDGTGATQITRNFTSDFFPAWSPDGTRLVFAGHGSIYIAGADGSWQTGPLAVGDRPDWQPLPADRTPGAAEVAIANVKDRLLAARASLPLRARAGVDRAIETLGVVLETRRWGADGAPSLNTYGLEALRLLRTAVARLTWSGVEARDATEQEKADLIALMGRIARARVDEVRAFMGEGAIVDRFALWRAERHLRDGDADLNRVRATLRYVAAWQTLMGQSPCC